MGTLQRAPSKIHGEAANSEITDQQDRARKFLSRTLSSRVPGEMVTIALGQAAAAIGGFASVKILTTHLTRAEYGQFGLALTAVTLVQLCIGGPIAQAAVRYYSPAAESGRLNEYRSGLTWLLAVTSAPVLAAGAILAAVASAGHLPYAKTVLACSLLAVCYGISITCDGIQSGARKRVTVALHQAGTQWLRAILPLIVFIALRSQSTLAAITGYLLATLIVITSQMITLSRLIGQKMTPEANTPNPFRKDLLRYARPFASWGLISWLQMASDRWFLEAFHGPASVGAFTACYQIGYYPTMLAASAISALFGPIMFQQAGDGEDAGRLRKADRLNLIQILTLVAITCLLCLGTFLFRDQIFSALTNRDYSAYDRELPWLACSSGLFSIGQAFSFYFLLRGDAAKLTWPKILTSTGGALFNYIGARYYGVHGAAVSSALFGAVYTASLLTIVRIHSTSENR